MNDSDVRIIKYQLNVLRGYVETVLQAIDAIGEMFPCEHPRDSREYLPTSRMGNLEWRCTKCNRTFTGDIEGDVEEAVVKDGSTHS